jgi:hypothetical protein
LEGRGHIPLATPCWTSTLASKRKKHMKCPTGGGLGRGRGLSSYTENMEEEVGVGQEGGRAGNGGRAGEEKKALTYRSKIIVSALPAPPPTPPHPTPPVLHTEILCFTQKHEGNKKGRATPGATRATPRALTSRSIISQQKVPAPREEIHHFYTQMRGQQLNVETFTTEPEGNTQMLKHMTTFTTEPEGNN